MTTIPQRPTISAELHRAIGEVPLERIRMVPFPGTATEDDYLELVNQDIACELVNGVIVEKPMAYPESLIAAYVIIMIGQHVLTHQLGVLSGERGSIRFAAGAMREPDLTFTAWSRFSNSQVPRDAISKIVPNLCVEVLSPSNTRLEMVLKRELYFKTNVELVWMIDPDSETIDVYTSESKFTTLTTHDTLDGGTVLPGFSIAVRDIFHAWNNPPSQGTTP